MKSSPPVVSVILPVRENIDGLLRVLESLARQTYPPHFFEVVVVTNGTPTAPAFTVPRTPFALTLLHNPIAGSYRARNLGIRHARGAILAFTDSDCLPQIDWIAEGVAQLEREPCGGIVAGRILPLAVTKVTPLAFYQLLDFFPQDFYVEECRFGATACLFAHRKVFERVGLFREDLYSGGDVEWGERASKIFPLRFCPEVIVNHPLRKGFREVLRRERRCAGGLGMRNRSGTDLRDLAPALRRKSGRLFFRLQKLAGASGASFATKLATFGLLIFFQGVWIVERSRVFLRGTAINS